MGSTRVTNWVTWVGAPDITEEAPKPHGPCRRCVLGDCHLCTGVGCYDCDRPAHQRKHGFAATGNNDA